LDSPSLTYLIVILALLILHAVIVMSKNALVDARAAVLRDRAEDGNAAAVQALRLIDRPASLAITTDLALTLLKFCAGGVAFVWLEQPLMNEGDTISPLTIVAITISLMLVTYVLADLLPGTVGRAYAEELVLTAAAFMSALVFGLRPFTWVLEHLEKAFARAQHEEDLAKTIIEEEIIDLVDSGEREGVIEDEERNMIRSVLEFDETLVREIMIPRTDIVAIDIDDALRNALKSFIDSGHSRLPVYEGQIDHVKGLLYAKDLLMVWHNGQSEQSSIRQLMRPAHFIPETKRADELFREFQNKKIHLAVVLDEYATTVGLVTLEDLVEEIVGDIRDEFDVNEEAKYTPIDENAYVVDAAMNIYDLNQLLNSDLPSDEADSIGGFVYGQLAHDPEVGETLEAHGLTMRVHEVRGIRIRKVYVAPIPKPNSEAPAAPDTARTTGIAADVEAQPAST
jgi:putative hemolysin